MLPCRSCGRWIVTGRLSLQVINMKNKKSHYGLLLSLLLHGIATLAPISAVASIQLEGVWDDYTSGAHGVWELTSQTSSADALFWIDFLGNGSEPEPLSLSGYTDASVTAFLNTAAHQTFGDVSALPRIPLSGAFILWVSGAGGVIRG